MESCNKKNLTDTRLRVTVSYVKRLRKRLTYVFGSIIMKTKGILNSDVSRVLSYMRHTDLICIGDCGLPCPESVELIDLSVSKNLPSFLQVLDAVLDDYKAEKFFLATEIKDKNPKIKKEIDSRLNSVDCTYITHDELKEKLSKCKAVIRTGEMSPYANIILQSACIF